MGSNSYFCKIIADVFLYVNNHLNAPDQQIAKTSVFIDMLTLDPLIKCIWFATSGCFLPSLFLWKQLMLWFGGLWSLLRTPAQIVDRRQTETSEGFI